MNSIFTCLLTLTASNEGSLWSFDEHNYCRAGKEGGWMGDPGPGPLRRPQLLMKGATLRQRRQRLLLTQKEPQERVSSGPRWTATHLMPPLSGIIPSASRLTPLPAAAAPGCNMLPLSTELERRRRQRTRGGQGGSSKRPDKAQRLAATPADRCVKCDHSLLISET